MGQIARVLSFWERKRVVLVLLLPDGSWLHTGAVDAERLRLLCRCIPRGLFIHVCLKCKGDDVQSCSVPLL